MTRFEEDKGNTFIYGDKNGSRPMTRAYWNLVVSVRDLNLFCVGISPNRHWRLKHVKDYFGIKGGKEKILTQLEDMLEEYKLELSKQEQN